MPIPRRRASRAVLGRGDGLLLGLDLSDHLHHLPQPAALAQQFGPQTGRERLTLGVAQRLEAFLPIAPGRLELADTLRHQQPSVAVPALLWTAGTFRPLRP